MLHVLKSEVFIHGGELGWGGGGLGPLLLNFLDPPLITAQITASFPPHLALVQFLQFVNTGCMVVCSFKFRSLRWL